MRTILFGIIFACQSLYSNVLLSVRRVFAFIRIEYRICWDAKKRKYRKRLVQVALPAHRYYRNTSALEVNLQAFCDRKNRRLVTDTLNKHSFLTKEAFVDRFIYDMKSCT